MSIYFGGEEYSRIYAAGEEFSGLEVAGEPYISRGRSYQLNMSTDRIFTDTPAAGPNVGSIPTFDHDGDTWEVWQIIPFLGASIVGTTLGDLRFQGRIEGQSAASLNLADLPDVITVTRAEWTGSPLSFTRPTSGAKYRTAGSGGSIRRVADYTPTRAVIGASPAALGISGPPPPGQADNFDVTFTFLT